MLKVQRLNMDNSWLIHIENTKILVDPWLIGAEVDYFPWFNKQWHRTKPIAIEELPEHDFCLITQKYPDHFHKDTLSIIQPDKIVGPKSIQKYVKRLLPKADFMVFEKTLENVFDSGVSLFHLPTSRRIDPIYDAIILSKDHINIFIATHGFALNKEQEELINQLKPFDLLITPLNKYKLPVVLGGYVAPGMESVEALVKQIQPNYIAATHDEDKHARGLVSKFARITWAPKATELKTNPIFGDKFLDLKDYQTYDL